MQTYSVFISKYVDATVEVQANSPAEAETLAEQLLKQGKVAFSEDRADYNFNADEAWELGKAFPDVTRDTKLEQQLETLMLSLRDIPESSQPGNAAYYLSRLAEIVAARGVNEPLVAALWLKSDLEENDTLEKDHARRVFAHIDRTHNAEIGINWDVLNNALEEVP